METEGSRRHATSDVPVNPVTTSAPRIPMRSRRPGSPAKAAFPGSACTASGHRPRRCLADAALRTRTVLCAIAATALLAACGSDGPGAPAAPLPPDGGGPVISALEPSSAAVGAGPFTLTVRGSSFAPGSVVRWDGSDRPTTFVSPTQLTAAIPAGDLAGSGAVPVTVFNPASGGVTSAAASFSRIPAVPAESWILARPAIASAISWEDAEGVRSYPLWTAAERAELTAYVEHARTGSATAGGTYPISQVPDNLWAGLLTGTEFPATVLAAADARGLYLAHVAHALWIESSRAVPWSLDELTDAELAILLDSRSMFSWAASANAVGRPRGYRLTYFGLPAPPDSGFAFLRAHGLLGATRLATIENVVGWTRRMNHFIGGFQAEVAEAHWQYRGVPPLMRVLNGTVNAGAPGPYGQTVLHWTLGCHGTNTVLRDLLRHANIPVEYTARSGHAIPHFVTEGRYLSHGDDPYSRAVQGPPPLPGNAELLIDSGTWTRWFGPNVPNATAFSNIGRQARELMLVYLTEPALEAYCHDQMTGAAREQSRVFALFSRDYTLAELDDLGLWPRLSQRTAQLGGWCS
jgi:hypothetical protein